MKAGTRQHKLELQTKSSTPDSYGQPTLTYTKLADCWAQLESIDRQGGALGAKELILAMQQGSEVTHIATINWSTTIENFGADDRVLWGTRTFDVLAVLEGDHRRRMLQLVLKERL